MSQGANNERPAGSQPAKPAGQTGPLPKPAQPGQTGPLPKPGQAAVQRVGNFEILGKIGKGGMGTVFKARQVMMDRIVALKILPPHLARNKQFVVRFLREAQSAARLSHPNIVGAFDAGVADGYNYFAMEYVDGQGLDKLIHESGGKLSEERALEIVRDVAKALDYAHSAGIIHRDIKPDNILISNDGVTKLADLGLARETGQSEMHLTQTGVAIGTPNYIAPEQVRGESDLDGRCDIYALGATLYHLVTGSPPYVGGTGTEVMSKHLTEPVPDARKINPSVSPETVALIRKSMAKTRKGRHATAGEFLTDVERILQWKKNPKAAAAVAPEVTMPSARRSQAAAETSKLPYYIGAAVALALIVGVVIALNSGDKANTGQPKPPVEVKQPEQPQPPVTRPQEPEHPQEPKVDPQSQQKIAAEKVIKELVAQKKYGDALKHIEDLRSTLDGRFLDGQDHDVKLGALEQYNILKDKARAAMAEGNFAAAKNSLEEVKAFGIAEIAAEADNLIASISQREKEEAERIKSEAENKKVEDIRARFLALIEENKLAEAEAVIKELNAVDLPGKEKMLNAAMKTLSAAKKSALAIKLKAYSAESAAYWDLLKKRDYPNAEYKINELAKKPEYSNDQEIANIVALDKQVLTRVKQFWARAGKGINIGMNMAGGTVVQVTEDNIIIELPGSKNKITKKLTETIKSVSQAEKFAKINDEKNEEEQLMLGCFFLAEDAESVKAMEAFQRFPDKTEYYRSLLQEKYNNAVAQEAAKLWEQIRQAGDKVPKTEKPDTSLGKLIANFESRFSETDIYKDNARELQDIRRKLVYVYRKWSYSEAANIQKEAAETLGLPVEKEIKVGDVKIQMILIPAAEFQMGDTSDAMSRRTVRLTMPYYISKNELTQEQWKAVMKDESEVKDPLLPKENISWYDSSKFLKTLSEINDELTFRFPTQAEWELACRAGTNSPYFFGDNITSRQANFMPDSNNKPIKIGSCSQNSFGINDMHGNVAEWCSDWYQEGWQDKNSKNPTGPHDGIEKAVRGGGWNQAANKLMSFAATGEKPDVAREALGLRIAASIPGLESGFDAGEPRDVVRGDRRRQTYNQRQGLPDIEWAPGSEWVRGMEGDKEVWSRTLNFKVGKISEAWNWQIQSEDGRQTEIISPKDGKTVWSITNEGRQIFPQQPKRPGENPGKRITKEDIEKWLKPRGR